MLGVVLVQLLLQSKVGALENNRWTNAYIAYSETVWYPFCAQKVDIRPILDPSIKSLIKKQQMHNSASYLRGHSTFILLSPITTRLPKLYSGGEKHLTQFF